MEKSLYLFLATKIILKHIEIQSSNFTIIMPSSKNYNSMLLNLQIVNSLKINLKEKRPKIWQN